MKEFNIKLSEERLNLILSALTELPWKAVNETIQDLLRQASSPPTEPISQDIQQ